MRLHRDPPRHRSVRASVDRSADQVGGFLRHPRGRVDRDRAAVTLVMRTPQNSPAMSTLAGGYALSPRKLPHKQRPPSTSFFGCRDRAHGLSISRTTVGDCQHLDCIVVLATLSTPIRTSRLIRHGLSPREVRYSRHADAVLLNTPGSIKLPIQSWPHCIQTSFPTSCVSNKRELSLWQVVLDARGQISYQGADHNHSRALNA